MCDALWRESAQNYEAVGKPLLKSPAGVESCACLLLAAFHFWPKYTPCFNHHQYWLRCQSMAGRELSHYGCVSYSDVLCSSGMRGGWKAGITPGVTHSRSVLKVRRLLIVKRKNFFPQSSGTLNRRILRSRQQPESTRSRDSEKGFSIW